MGVGAGMAGAMRFRLRFPFTGELATVGKAWQLEDGATGWAVGVGLTPWCHVLVPYTPIGKLENVSFLSFDNNGPTYSSSPSQFSNTPGS